MKIHKAKQMYSSSTRKHNEHDSNCQHITRQICQVDTRTSVPATNQTAQPLMSHSTLCYWREHRKWELGSIQLQVLYKLFVTELWASVHRSLHSQFSGCEGEGVGWGWGHQLSVSDLITWLLQEMWRQAAFAYNQSGRIFTPTTRIRQSTQIRESSVSSPFLTHAHVCTEALLCSSLSPQCPGTARQNRYDKYKEKFLTTQ